MTTQIPRPGLLTCLAASPESLKTNHPDVVLTDLVNQLAKFAYGKETMAECLGLAQQLRPECTEGTQVKVVIPRAFLTSGAMIRRDKHEKNAVVCIKNVIKHLRSNKVTVVESYL